MVTAQKQFSVLYMYADFHEIDNRLWQPRNFETLKLIGKIVL